MLAAFISGARRLTILRCLNLFLIRLEMLQKIESLSAFSSSASQPYSKL